MNKSMLLVTSTWGNKQTFRLIPACLEAPYNEAIYDPEAKVLALIGKDKKESFQMMPKLNEFGDPQVIKIGKRPNGKDYAESRQVLDTYYEYYVENQSEIIDLVNRLAFNVDTYDFESYMSQTEAPLETSALITV